MNNCLLESKRLILRKLDYSDAEAIFSNWTSDEEVAKYVTWNHHKTMDETKYILDIWMKQYDDPKTVRLGIVIKETKELVGIIDIVDFIDDNPEVGYCLSRKYWNNGYMSEACELFINYLFELGYKKVIIEADEENIASNKVIVKNGFEFTHKETRKCSQLKPKIITVNWYEKINI